MELDEGLHEVVALAFAVYSVMFFVFREIVFFVNTDVLGEIVFDFPNIIKLIGCLPVCHTVGPGQFAALV